MVASLSLCCHRNFFIYVSCCICSRYKGWQIKEINTQPVEASTFDKLFDEQRESVGTGGELTFLLSRDKVKPKRDGEKKHAKVDIFFGSRSVFSMHKTVRSGRRKK